MPLISFQFAGFVFLTLLVYRASPERFRKHILLLASIVFYATYSWLFPMVMALLVGVNHWAAQRLQNAVQRRPGLWIVIGINIVSLLVLKYGGAFPAWQGGNLLALLFPLGYSFRVLEAISYQVDIYSGRQKKLASWLDLALYLYYFPKLLAGPIEKAHQFLARLAAPFGASSEKFITGSALLVIGLFRKVVLADTLLAIMPEKVFLQPADFLAPELILWILAYCFYLYNDFCGYTDIIRGISAFFGISLARNFSQPFFAKTFYEFWTRWHISLSSWLRDYLYMPLTRYYLRRYQGRLTFSSILIPTSLTMVASGLWHGINLNFLVWGLLMAGYQVIEQVLGQRAGSHVKTGGARVFSRQLLVLGLVVFAGLFFRMEVEIAWEYIQTIITGSYRVTNVLLLLALVRVAILVLPSLWLDWYQRSRQDEIAFLKWRPGWQALVLVLFFYACVWALQLQTASSAFVYQGF